MLIVRKIKNIFTNNTKDYSPQFEHSKWSEEQVMLGEVSGVDTSVYNYPNLSPTLMECARKQLELGSAPASIKLIVDSYLKGEITEKEFEDLCEESIYVIDLEYLKNKFKIITEPEESPKTHDIPAAFYGASFNDIAGSKYEFTYKLKDREGLTFDNCICTDSQPTDDTILSCATAVGMKQKLIINDKQTISLKEYHKNTTYPFANNPFSSIYKDYAKRPFAGASYGGGFYSWLHSDEIRPYGSYGNGSAMRVSPIGDYFDNQEDVIVYAAASAAATHNHMEGVIGAVVTAMAIWMAKQGYSKKQIFDYIIGFYPEERTEKYIYKGISLKEFTMEELKYAIGPPICQYSVPAAAICFYYADSFEDVTNNILSFEGDTDTIGAIAGSIAGAYYGIPEYAKNVVDERKPEEIFDIALSAIKQK